MPRDATIRTCVFCGYDLRALASGRCPECGNEYRWDYEKARYRFRDESVHVLVIWMALLFGVTVVRFLFVAPAGVIEDLDTILVIGTALLVAGVAGLAFLPTLRRPRPLRQLEWLLWLRASCWLHLPWVVMPLALLAVSITHEIVAGFGGAPALVPTERGAILLLIFIGIPLLAFLRFARCVHVLTERVGLPPLSVHLPFLVAFIVLLVTMTWAGPDLAFFDLR